MSTELGLTSTRVSDHRTPEILTRRGGLFWGLTLLLIGTLWFLDTAEVISLGDKFAQLVVPFILIVGGLYLLTMKLAK
jgi:hypothetical protein